MLSNRKTAPPNRIEQVISLFHQTSPDRNRFHYNCYDNSLYKNRCHNFVCTHSHMHQYSSLGNLPSKKTHNWYYNHQRQHLPASSLYCKVTNSYLLLIRQTLSFCLSLKIMYSQSYSPLANYICTRQDLSCAFFRGTSKNALIFRNTAHTLESGTLGSPVFNRLIA